MSNSNSSLANADAPRSSLSNNFKAMAIATIVYALCQWATIAVIARKMSPVEVGIFTFGQAITTPLFVSAGMNLRSVQSTDIKNNYRFGDYLGLRLAMLAVALIFTVVFAFGSQTPHIAWIVIFVGLAKVGDGISDLFFGLFQRHEHMPPIAISRLVQGVLQFAALALGILAGQSLLIGALCFAVASLVTVLFYNVPVLIRENRRFNWEKSLAPVWDLPVLWRLLRLSFPLAIIYLLDSLILNVPRYYVEHHLGKAALGFYSAAAYVITAVLTIVFALAEATRPRLASLYKSNHPQFLELLKKLIFFSLLLGGGGTLLTAIAGKPLLTLLYGAEYSEHSLLLIWLMLGATAWFMTIFLSAAIVAAQKFFVQVPVLVASTLATITACALLVPAYGLIGASWGFCAGMLVRLILTLALAVRILKNPAFE